MSEGIQLGDGGWFHSVPPPSSFDHKAQAAYQKRIDDAIGTARDGRPLMKLTWAPDELRWMPHKLGDEPQGYTFPIFCTGKDVQGNFTAPERWVLLERVEPEQFAATWEAKRYANWKGVVYDVKGPCPSEKYVELRCHSYHDGECCACVGDTCACGELYDHCWGKYAQPDEHLLVWIRQTAWEARQDSDVKPLESELTFESPEAQRQLLNDQLATQQSSSEIFRELDKEIADYWTRQPVSVSGERRTQSGLILLP